MPFKIIVCVGDFIGYKIISHKVTDLDDRAYVVAMGAYLLQQLRREHLVTRKKPDTTNMLDQFKIRAPQRHESIFS